jgi:pyruvoyl-dependent arginine decarboxylase (PvlArgDC)
MLAPHDKSMLGYIIEFKSFNARLNHKNLDEVAASALQQIEDRKYETELRRRGISRIKKLAIVFKGQLVKIVEAGVVAKT